MMFTVRKLEQFCYQKSDDIFSHLTVHACDTTDRRTWHTLYLHATHHTI